MLSTMICGFKWHGANSAIFLIQRDYREDVIREEQENKIKSEFTLHILQIILTWIFAPETE